VKLAGRHVTQARFNGYVSMITQTIRSRKGFLLVSRGMAAHLDFRNKLSRFNNLDFLYFQTEFGFTHRFPDQGLNAKQIVRIDACRATPAVDKHSIEPVIGNVADHIPLSPDVSISLKE